jgi:glycine C-acetyltransferase
MKLIKNIEQKIWKIKWYRKKLSGGDMKTSVISAVSTNPLSTINQDLALGDPFNGYFNKSVKLPSKGLLDIANAKRWFNVIEWGCRNDFYTCQQTLERKSGPRVRVRGQEFLMISSYDYLGLIGHTEIEQAAIEAIREYGTGTGGVRLLTGTTYLHRQFEAELATFKGTEATITFSSGYMANLAIISSLLGPCDRAILDEKAHRSVVDACKVARVPVQTFCHNDSFSLQKELEKKPFGCRTLIVVEGIYSMDGDICPLPEMVELKKKYNTYLMVDEAHSFGVLGPTGRGVDQYFESRTKDVDIWMGSLSKAIPSNGGFIAGPQDLIIYLQHGAAPFMFSATLCPSAIAAARQSLRILKREPERLKKLHHNADFVRSHLKDLGYNTGKSVSPIIPIITGDEETACRLARELLRVGILATAVIYPAVPRGGARLRLCVTADHDEDSLREILNGFRTVRSKVKLLRDEAS